MGVNKANNHILLLLKTIEMEAHSQDCTSSLCINELASLDSSSPSIGQPRPVCLQSIYKFSLLHHLCLLIFTNIFAHQLHCYLHLVKSLRLLTYFQDKCSIKMCIHFFEAQYSCGCRRDLPRYGPGYKPPRLCAAVKTAHSDYHAQPRYLPLDYPLPPPKPCPPITSTGNTARPGNIAILNCDEICPVHFDLAHLCQLSEKQRVAGHHHALDSGVNTNKKSLPITGWREIGGDQAFIGEFHGEDGPFNGVECYKVNPAVRAKGNPHTNTLSFPLNKPLKQKQQHDEHGLQSTKPATKSSRRTIRNQKRSHRWQQKKQQTKTNRNGITRPSFSSGSATLSPNASASSSATTYAGASVMQEIRPASSVLPAQQVAYLSNLLYVPQTLNQVQAILGQKGRARGMSV